MITPRKGEILINDLDAFDTWGVFFSEESLSSLLSPPALKDFPTDSNRMMDGEVLDTSIAKVESKDLVLTMYIYSDTLVGFFKNYEKFCDEVLFKGSFTLRCIYFPEKKFRLVYESCQQFSELYLSGYAKFALKVVEPNPKNRSL